jgi:hypothetical protein
MCRLKKNNNNKQETIYSNYFLNWVLLTLLYMFVKLSCVYVSFKVFTFIVVSWIVCRVIADLCILWSIYVYSLSVYLW